MAKIMRERLAGLAPRRKRAGYSQETFAAALDIERARLANYEVGISWPSAALLPAMAELLNCSIDDLYEAPAESIAEAEG